MIISYAQNFEDVMLWRALHHIENGFYIDVGANDPTIASVTRVFYERGWNGINIEPLSTHSKDLQRERERDINLCCAAGATPGEIDIWECNIVGWASADRHVIENHIATGKTGHYQRVPVRTLTDICEKHAPADIHFLKIDVEGFEREVILGMDFKRFRPWIVVVEATKPSSPEEVYQHWEALLLVNDYFFAYADGLNRFYLAQERNPLAAAFRYPPNFFDFFCKAEQVQAEQNVHIAQAQAQRAQAQAQQAETQVRQALARAESAEKRARQVESLSMRQQSTVTHLETRLEQTQKLLDLMQESTSWRMTKPIRLAENTFKQYTTKENAHRMWVRSRVLLAYSHARLYVNRRPALKRSVLTLLKRLPVVVNFIEKNVHAYPKTIPHKETNDFTTLTRHARRIHASLISEIKRSEETPIDVNIFTKKENDSLFFLSSDEKKRPRLAYISPLPPERSGISDYSAELLPELARHYEIDVVIAQPEVASPWISENCRALTIDEFLRRSHQYDRVVYHFGNSPIHSHMFDLLEVIPGIVVLHDFFLGDAMAFRESQQKPSHALTWALYNSHGYAAVAERFGDSQAKAIQKFPACFEIFQNARGVFVHSEHSRHLAEKWFGHQTASVINVVPLLRAPGIAGDRTQIRERLGINIDDFVVCSFGMLGSTKLNKQLLNAFLRSSLAKQTHCMLIFVGQNPDDEYGQHIMDIINASGLQSRIRISGWIDLPVYHDYLRIADAAVQLRSHSRGETSAAVLDCMNYGIPTIINAHGALAEYTADHAWILPDTFESEHLVHALETLESEPALRNMLGKRAQEHVHARHAPGACALQYKNKIEHAYSHPRIHWQTPIYEMAHKNVDQHDTQAFIEFSQNIARTYPQPASAPQLLLDVSVTCRNDLKTGIQRVVRALTLALIQAQFHEYRIEPVYLCDDGGQWRYRYARRWVATQLNIPKDWATDDVIEQSANDKLLVLDFTGAYFVEAERAGLYRRLKAEGVKIEVILYDMLPLLFPHFFPPGGLGYSQWLEAVEPSADKVICISRSVASNLQDWLNGCETGAISNLAIEWFHLGADVENSAPTAGVPVNATQTLKKLSEATSFLMVGTIEPRKGHLQVIAAFTQLWERGLEINLVIVGNEGWKHLPDDCRSTIPQIVSTLRQHPERDRRLFWLEDVSDEYLEQIYAAGHCLIAASEGEGFGLPLIEAAHHHLPIIARDIAVFREIAGDNAFYFDGLEKEDLMLAIDQWLKQYKQNCHPQTVTMPLLTWKQSAAQLINVLCNNTLIPFKTV